MNALRSCLVLLPLVFLGGCLDYTEEVFVNADGTGRMKLDLALLADELAPEDIKELRGALDEAATELRRDGEVSKVDVADFLEGKKHHFVFDVHTTKYQAISRIFEFVRLDGVEGQDKQLRFVRYMDDAGSLTLRAMSGRRAPDVGRADDSARLLGSKLAARRGLKAKDTDEQFHLTFKVHAPKVLKSNGEVGRKVATWRWNLEEIDETTIPSRLEADLDLSSASLLPFAVAAFGFGFAFLWLRKQWKRRAH